VDDNLYGIDPSLIVDTGELDASNTLLPFELYVVPFKVIA
jgi:hypothetical protein